MAGVATKAAFKTFREIFFECFTMLSRPELGH
jgi:hypothetical protein